MIQYRNHFFNPTLDLKIKKIPLLENEKGDKNLQTKQDSS